MGREQPTVVLRPNQTRRDERAKRARDTKNKVIPDLLRACPRAKHGIAKVQLIVDPPPAAESSPPPQISPGEPCIRPGLKIRVQALDTLSAAARISEKLSSSQRTGPAVRQRSSKPNVAILNMASALRPGGGFLEGANSQEEFLCARTTVYPSLWDSFYRLPDVSGIYTPDVLVFRDHLPEANDLPKKDRFFVDVISSSMLRFADAKAEGCTCGVSFCDRHRDVVLRKMKAVLRIAQSNGIEKLVLGAWGCGAHGNPIHLIAKNWRKVIAGMPRQRRPNVERWDGINEIIFAIPDRNMLYEFESAFRDVLCKDTPPSSQSPADSGIQSTAEDERTSELLTKIASIELQMEQTQNSRLKGRLRETLAALQRELHTSPSTKESAEEDKSPDEDGELSDDHVVPGFLGSDEEELSFYHLADEDSDVDSSDHAIHSDYYEFRPPAPGLASNDEESMDDSLYQVTSRSPHFDPETGWFAGSVDGLTALLSNGGGGLRSCSHVSPGSPDLVRPTSGGDLGIDAEALHSYLSRYQGTDAAHDDY